MIDRWANHEEIGSSDVFETLHSGLTVRLIATVRDDLMTCESHDAVSAVIDRNTEHYDFIPVIGGRGGADPGIIGLFHAEKFRKAPIPQGCVNEHFQPLSEDFLIGADASILDFVRSADEKPCRLVVSGSRILGLVSLSDLQKLPVRAALFALVTGFEIIMFESIRQKFAMGEAWMAHLSDGRKDAIKIEIEKSKRNDGFVDVLLFTQFCDKADIIRKSFQFVQSKGTIRNRLAEIQDLRDNLAHANEYAASPAEATRVCRVVRNLLALRDELAKSTSPCNAGRGLGR